MHIRLVTRRLQILPNKFFCFVFLSASVAVFFFVSVAQLDARPTGDQEGAGLNPCQVGNILMEI